MNFQKIQVSISRLRQRSPGLNFAIGKNNFGANIGTRLITMLQMRITPAELLEDGFADAFVPPDTAATWCVAAIDRLRLLPSEQRLATRRDRWSSAL